MAERRRKHLGPVDSAGEAALGSASGPADTGSGGEQRDT